MVNCVGSQDVYARSFPARIPVEAIGSGVVGAEQDPILVKIYSHDTLVIGRCRLDGHRPADGRAI